MKKAPSSALCLIAMVLVLILANPVQAVIHPLDLPAVPADSMLFSAADNEIQDSLPRHDFRPHESQPTLRAKLTLANAHATHIPYLLVGNRAPMLSPRGLQNLDVRPSDDLRDEWAFMRRATSGPSSFERLGQMFDVEEDERPWSTVTTVHILTSTNARPGALVPFATIAHEMDVNEDLSRIGIGAGAMIILGKNATLGAEVVHFGTGGSERVANDSFSTETRFLTRLQLSF